MTDQPEMTSNLGRQWLSQTSNTPDPANDPPNDLKSVSMNAASPTGVMGSIPVVSIPFFDTIDKTLGLVNQASGGQETGKQLTDSSTAFVDANVEAVVASDSVKTATRVADLSQFSSPSPSVSMPNISIPNMSTPAVKSDRSEDPSDWMEKVGSPTTPRDGKANSDAAASEKYTSAIDGLVDSVLERFPLAAPTILLFVGSENNPHIDETCAELAVMLSKRNVGDVLLVERWLRHEVPMNRLAFPRFTTTLMVGSRWWFVNLHRVWIFCRPAKAALIAGTESAVSDKPPPR